MNSIRDNASWSFSYECGIVLFSYEKELSEVEMEGNVVGFEALPIIFCEFCYQHNTWMSCRTKSLGYEF